MRQPVMISIDSSDPKVAIKIQNGLQKLIDNVQIGDMIAVADTICENPKKIASVITKYKKNQKLINRFF